MHLANVSTMTNLLCSVRPGDRFSEGCPHCPVTFDSCKCLGNEPISNNEAKVKQLHSQRDVVVLSVIWQWHRTALSRVYRLLNPNKQANTQQSP